MIGLGMIGLGMISRFYPAALRAVPSLALTILCDPDERCGGGCLADNGPNALDVVRCPPHVARLARYAWPASARRAADDGLATVRLVEECNPREGVR
jgi:hypothetical protein